MKCKAITVDKPNSWNYGEVEIGEPNSNEALVRVLASSICHTDLQILNGTLCYYKNGKAKYPIITGHEWYGEYEGQVVVGLCLLKNGYEVGVINKNGAHAQYIIMPKTALIEVPSADMCYVLTEPAAVVIHGLSRLNLKTFSKILINGYGTIGRICSAILKENGYKHDIYDPRYTPYKNAKKNDLIIECSGAKTALNNLVKQQTILAFGFDYDNDINEFVTKGITFVGTLGSTLDDFKQAIEIVPKINNVPLDAQNLSDFETAITQLEKSGKKSVFSDTNPSQKNSLIYS